MAIGGTITFFLVLLFNISPLLEFQNQDTRTAFFYGLSSTNMVVGSVIRYSGYFDEPGAMAFWGIWGLITNRLFFQNKTLEFVLMVTLIFTFSMAYYIQLFFYIVLYKLKSIMQFFYLILLCALIGGGIYASKDSELDLYALTFYRFELSDSGSVNGDNRSDLAKIAKKYFKKAPIFGIGARNGTENCDYMGDNPYTTLAYDGIVGTITIYLPLLILWFMAKRSKFIRKAIFIIALGYLQRPYNVYFISPFIMYSFFILSDYKIKQYKLLSV